MNLLIAIQAVAAIASILTPVGLLLVALVNSQAQKDVRKDAKAAAEAAEAAQQATAKAAVDAEKAKEAAAIAVAKQANALAQLIQTARSGNEKLEQIVETSERTHNIVNSANTNLLVAIQMLTARIAKENPEDNKAQVAAREAAEAARVKTSADARSIPKP